MRGFAAFLLAWLCWSAAAFAQPRLVVVGGDASEVVISGESQVRHKAAGFQFPDHIGDMPLRKVIVYGPGDVSVDYTLRGGGNADAWITFFVYPTAGRAFVDEASDIEKSLVDKWSALRIAPLAPAPPTAADGKSGWFHGTFGGMKATNGYILVQRGAWFLEVRYTIPDAEGESGIKRTIRAIDDLPWAWRPTPAPVTG